MIWNMLTRGIIIVSGVHCTCVLVNRGQIFHLKCYRWMFSSLISAYRIAVGVDRRRDKIFGTIYVLSKTRKMLVQRWKVRCNEKLISTLDELAAMTVERWFKIRSSIPVYVATRIRWMRSINESVISEKKTYFRREVIRAKLTLLFILKFF